MSTLDELVANVAAEDTVIDSAVLTIAGLQKQIADLKTPSTDANTAAKIDALNTDITNKRVALAAAIVTGTAVTPPVAGTTPVVTPADANAAATAASAAVK